MTAAVYVGDGAIEVQDLPVPELGARDALIEVSHCGICGTDLSRSGEVRAAGFRARSRVVRDRRGGR
jgi:threonine dehydrogenase-like Zn-dependent dehydrogenase